MDENVNSDETTTGSEKNDEKTSNSGEKSERKREVASRGVPSSEALYLPAHYSQEIRAFQDDGEILTRNLWNLEEVMHFVFPKHYQKKYNEIAIGFMQLLLKNLKLRGTEINTFILTNNISKATFYNRVLPRLKRIGMIKVERETIIAEESKRKYRPMIISVSKTFGNYLIKIGDSWLASVDDARTISKKENVFK